LQNSPGLNSLLLCEILLISYHLYVFLFFLLQCILLFQYNARVSSCLHGYWKRRGIQNVFDINIMVILILLISIKSDSVIKWRLQHYYIISHIHQLRKMNIIRLICFSRSFHFLIWWESLNEIDLFLSHERLTVRWALRSIRILSFILVYWWLFCDLMLIQ
jgi:hypothetical protein